jgi:hypothetical protein
MKRLLIQIKNPCSENPSNFIPTQSGGFCSSCQKEVIDFRKMSKEEVLAFIQQNPQNKCGIFRHEHLATDQTKKSPRRLGPLWIMATLGLLGLSLPAQSQPISPSKIEQKIRLAEVPSVKKPADPNRMIKGKIFSGDDKLTLPGVRVLIKGTKVGVLSNENGEFEIEIPESFRKKKIELIISFIGFQRVEMKIKLKEIPLEIKDIYLPIDDSILGPYGVITPKISTWRSLLAFLGFEESAEQRS